MVEHPPSTHYNLKHLKQNELKQIDLTFDATRIHYLLVGINNND